MAAKKKGSMSSMEIEEMVKNIEKVVPDVPEKNKAGMKQGNIVSVLQEAEAPATPRKKEGKPTGGRPRLNPHAQDKKLTIRIPEELHRQLRMVSADLGKPMTEFQWTHLSNIWQLTKNKTMTQLQKITQTLIV